MLQGSGRFYCRFKSETEVSRTSVRVSLHKSIRCLTLVQVALWDLACCVTWNVLLLVKCTFHNFLLSFLLRPVDVSSGSKSIIL